MIVIPNYLPSTIKKSDAAYFERPQTDFWVVIIFFDKWILATLFRLATFTKSMQVEECYFLHSWFSRKIYIHIVWTHIPPTLNKEVNMAKQTQTLISSPENNNNKNNNCIIIILLWKSMSNLICFILFEYNMNCPKQKTSYSKFLIQNYIRV